MFHRLTTLLVTIVVALHAMLGCCAHHHAHHNQLGGASVAAESVGYRHDACGSHPLAGDGSGDCQDEADHSHLDDPGHRNRVTGHQHESLACEQSPCPGGHDPRSCAEATCRFLPGQRNPGVDRIDAFTTLSMICDDVSATMRQRLVASRLFRPIIPGDAAIPLASRWQAHTQAWLL